MKILKPNRGRSIAAAVLLVLTTVMADPTHADESSTLKVPLDGGWTLSSGCRWWGEATETCSMSGTAETSTGLMALDLSLDSGGNGTVPADARTVSDVVFANSRVWKLHRLPAGATSASYTLTLDVRQVISAAEASIGRAAASSSLFAFAMTCPPGMSQMYATSSDTDGDMVRWDSGIMKRVPLTPSSSSTVHTVQLSLPISDGCQEIGVGLLGWARADLVPLSEKSPESPSVPYVCAPSPAPPLTGLYQTCTPDRVPSTSVDTVVQGYATAGFDTTLREIQAQVTDAG